MADYSRGAGYGQESSYGSGGGRCGGRGATWGGNGYDGWTPTWLQRVLHFLKANAVALTLTLLSIPLLYAADHYWNSDRAIFILYCCLFGVGVPIILFAALFEDPWGVTRFRNRRPLYLNSPYNIFRRFLKGISNALIFLTVIGTILTQGTKRLMDPDYRQRDWIEIATSVFIILAVATLLLRVLLNLLYPDAPTQAARNVAMIRECNCMAGRLLQQAEHGVHDARENVRADTSGPNADLYRQRLSTHQEIAHQVAVLHYRCRTALAEGMYAMSRASYTNDDDLLRVTYDWLRKAQAAVEEAANIVDADLRVVALVPDAREAAGDAVIDVAAVDAAVINCRSANQFNAASYADITARAAERAAESARRAATLAKKAAIAAQTSGYPNAQIAMSYAVEAQTAAASAQNAASAARTEAKETRYAGAGTSAAHASNTALRAAEVANFTRTAAARAVDAANNSGPPTTSSNSSGGNAAGMGGSSGMMGGSGAGTSTSAGTGGMGTTTFGTNAGFSSPTTGTAQSQL